MAMPPPAEEKDKPAPIGKTTESGSFVQAVVPGKPELTLETTTPSIEAIPLLDGKITIGFEINSNEIEAKHYELLDQVAAYLSQAPAKGRSTQGVHGRQWISRVQYECIALPRKRRQIIPHRQRGAPWTT
jgi:hypothetical protein